MFSAHETIEAFTNFPRSAPVFALGVPPRAAILLQTRFAGGDLVRVFRGFVVGVGGHGAGKKELGKSKKQVLVVRVSSANGRGGRFGARTMGGVHVRHSLS